VIGAGVAGLVLIVGAVALVLTSGDDGPDHPDAWDPRLADLVAVVEDEWGRAFVHPVHVDFLPDEEFETEVTADEAELTAEDRAEIEDASGLLRALGLIDGEVDLFEATNDLTGSGVIGLYDPTTERIQVRGDELTPTVEATLVHELTHVLQDQHVDLERDFGDDDEAATAFHAIVEGDASRIETAYVDALPAEEREALDAAEADQLAGVETDLEGVPDYLQASIGAPYALGESFLAVLIETEGEGVVEEIYDDPPSSMEQLYDPWSYLDDDEPVTVDTPELADGDELDDDGTVNVVDWLFLLGARLDPVESLDAADGWGGGAYAAFTRDGQTCVRADYVGDSAHDTLEMRQALEAWIELMPAGAASLDEHGEGLRLESCDPGDDAVEGNATGATDALTLAVNRTYLTGVLIAEGAPDEYAQCYADGIVREFDAAALSDPTGAAFEDIEAQRTMARVAQACEG
jgi:hypothetical protein